MAARDPSADDELPEFELSEGERKRLAYATIADTMQRVLFLLEGDDKYRLRMLIGQLRGLERGPIA